MKKYEKTWNEVNNSIEKGFYSDPVYNKLYRKVKTKSYEDKFNTSFYNAEIPKEGLHCIYQFY